METVGHLNIIQELQQLNDNLTLWLAESNDISGLDVYPNPTKNKLNISLSSTFNNELVNVKIINSLGQIVLDKKISSTNNSNLTVDTDFLVNGLYTLVITNSVKQFKSKFIKQ